MGLAISVVALGLVLAVLVAILPASVIWLLQHADMVLDRMRALARRLHLMRPAPVVTYDPPIERIASDLRRLCLARRTLRSGTPAVRRRGLQMAYDETLVAACHALQLPHALGELGEGMDREIERVRVEAALENAGLRFRSAAS